MGVRCIRCLGRSMEKKVTEKGMLLRYACAADSKEDLTKVVPGSEISFFKNGVCQGVAFKDRQGERYFPAASMYTLPNQPNCEVMFNFGPKFEFFPDNFDGRPGPKPMLEAPYHGYSEQTENGSMTMATRRKRSIGQINLSLTSSTMS
ncbi:hypothetical protein MLD38_004191 [Melastoma candidum]|uniref:Uncharacterized protein n=1 Tax=Melastoma candidum TaxID=119954 RepID=A0ACB9S4Z4_9MYRT|nr:hypothetical protein MLD38_004191 [Melastoma candidum]